MEDTTKGMLTNKIWKNDFIKSASNSIKNIFTKREPATLLHVTHWKAGSQWINRIFHHCAYNQIVNVEWDGPTLLTKNILPQKIYPALYISYERFSLLNLPKVWHRFIIFRDLRDTLISGYFSQKISHPVQGFQLTATNRNELNKLNLEEGLIYLMKEWLHYSANIQFSWVRAGEKFIRYENLININNDVKSLAPIISKATLIPKKNVISSIITNRFESITHGRKPGVEDFNSHVRKGIIGDWRNYFTENVKDAFKGRFGNLLIQAGYEKNFEW